ncbi:MAG: hypothetical protein U0175_33860 [Caldilineaceae bacterium]
MIDLAPNHKLGLQVVNPILLAGGSIGYGEAIHPALATEELGAVVVGPLLMQSRAGAPPPRLTKLSGGFVLNTALQNRGLTATLRNFARLWPRLGCPVIVQVAENNVRLLPRMVQQLEEIESVAGIELLLAHEVENRIVKTLIRAIINSCDLPLWVKLPMDRSLELAEICIQNEAVGLVIGSASAKLVSNSPIAGNAFGPMVFPHMVQALREVALLKLGCALIACGGIHTVEQVQQALDTGASALQLDSAIWVEPGLPAYLSQSYGRTDP